jgi:hypothetical protein
VSFFSQILLFDVWRTISKDIEVYSIVIYWFLKASGDFSLEFAAQLFNNLMTVFKAKQLKGKLIFRTKKMRGDIYVGLF